MEWMMNELKNFAITAGIRLVAAVFVLVIGFKITSIITKKIKSSRTMAEADVSVVSFISSFISLGLRIALIFSVIAILGVPMSSMVALVASAGVAIGLAVQGALSNLVGGIMILMFKPFKVGDYIEAQSVSGTVKSITVIYTVLATPDNKIVTVPNGALTNSVVINYSSEDTRRLDIEFIVGHESDVAQVKRILMSAAISCKEVLPDPAPSTMVTACDERGVHCCLRIWVFNDEYWNVKFELLESIRASLKKKNVEVHYPRLEIVNNEKDKEKDEKK